MTQQKSGSASSAEDASPGSSGDPEGPATTVAAGETVDHTVPEAFGPAQTTLVDPISISAAISGQSRPSQSARRNAIALPMGHALLEYTIEALLGSGGFGITYQAHDNNLQCTVAIKEYLPSDLAVRVDGQTVCARTESDTHGYQAGLNGFLAEARVLAGFRHPHIVRVIRFFEANNTAYLVMEYERGSSLRDWVREHDPLDEDQLLAMFLPLLEGLEQVHDAQILHRDIKPANLFVREDGGALVLLDFGAARQMDRADSRGLTSVLTPGFAPFEQYIAEGAQGPWSDLYALGGVLYWLVSGSKPLEAPSRIHRDDMAPAVDVGADRYSERFLRAIDWALRPDQTRRPQSVSQFVAALTGEAPIPEQATGPLESLPDRNRTFFARFLWLGAGSLIALLVVAIVLIFDPTPAADRAPQPAAATAGAPLAEPDEPPAENGVAAATVTPDDAARRRPRAVAQTQASAPPPAPALIVLDVVPQGVVILDGRRLGLSPPLKRIPVTPHRPHKLEIHSLTAAPSAFWTLQLDAGEERRIAQNFQ